MKYRRLALARRGRRYAGTCDLLAVSVFGERAGENNDCWHSILNNGVIRSRFLCKKSLMSIFYIESDSCIVYNRLSKKCCSHFFEVTVLAYSASLRRAAKPAKCENLTVFIRFGVHAAEAGTESPGASAPEPRDFSTG